MKAAGEGDFVIAFYNPVSMKRRTQLAYSADDTHARTERLKAAHTATFFAGRTGLGCEAPDPIFIVGMPRSGSTLIEQILASHSMIEGTEELYDLERIALDLAPGTEAMLRKAAARDFALYETLQPAAV